MIQFEKLDLPNGLRVVVHPDPCSQVVTMNLMYDVGSRDECPTKTGMAHLLEHFMFSGSQHIPCYDAPLQCVGGDNNAYTSTDVTNYYCTLPKQNLETAFWLESDRMLGLAFNHDLLEVQRKVVIEEFKERYLNQPYGDAWHHLTAMAYAVHPYQWPTIGKNINHIESISMDDIKDFFYKFYRPNNAVLVIAGGLNVKQVEQWCQKWFAPISPGLIHQRALPTEPKRLASVTKTVQGDVPVNRIYRVYHTPGKGQKGYYAIELLCNILGEGKSACLHTNLVEKQSLYTHIDAHMTGSLDPGLCVISGSLAPGTSCSVAEKALEQVLDSVVDIHPNQLEKAKNQIEAQTIFGQVELTHRAQALAEATLLNDTDLVNTELEYIRSVSLSDFLQAAEKMLASNNAITLRYEAK